MSQSREQVLEQLDGLGASLAAVLNRLGQIELEMAATKIELEMAATKNEACLQISAIRDFLNDPQISPPAGPDPAAGADVSRANEAIQKLSVGKTQEQILDIFLEEVHSLSERAILFLRLGDSYFAWKGLGFAASILGAFEVESDEDPIRRSARQQSIIYRTHDLVDAFPWLTRAGKVPATAVCVPLIFEETAPVVLYADSSQEIELDSLELLSHLAVLVLKNHSLMARVEGSTTDADKTAVTVPPGIDFESLSSPTSSPEPKTVKVETSAEDVSANDVDEVEELIPPESDPGEPLQAGREAETEEVDAIKDLADKSAGQLVEVGAELEQANLESNGWSSLFVSTGDEPVKERREDRAQFQRYLRELKSGPLQELDEET